MSTLSGSQFSIVWSLPFLGLLLSIALLPLLAPAFWHRHDGKISAAWALAFLLPLGLANGPAVVGIHVLHTLLAEYIPFILLLTALFTVTGGIHIRANWRGSPILNTAILAIGALFASLMGTTGASMLLIRPLIRANSHRVHNAHVVIFFIFIVANVGGALTPLGDPPLFLGFLNGVDFFWTARHIWPQTLFLVGSLLVIFYVLDVWFQYHHQEVNSFNLKRTLYSCSFEGAANFALLGIIAGLVLLSGLWKSAQAWEIAGVHLKLPSLVRDMGLLGIIGLSLRITPISVHIENQFSWLPMQEVAKLFAGIFLTMIPVMTMLKAGLHGPFETIISAVTHADGLPNPVMYFWVTGILSSFLDNAPTYLVFFNTAGGDPQIMMNNLASTLAALSAGAVFMGANTYIGNAPNLMVKSIAQAQGVKMPSFFGYMLWSGFVLTPLFILMTLWGFS